VPLVVVPLAPDDAAFLTLEEWDLLRACKRVYFELPDHPLVERLRAAGVTCGPFDDEPSAGDDGSGFVAAPRPRGLSSWLVAEQQ